MNFKVITIFSLALAWVCTTGATDAKAQLRGKLRSYLALQVAQEGLGYYNGTDAEGVTTTYHQGFISPKQSVQAALQNPYSPNRYYTYSNPGIEAQKTHAWNRSEEPNHSWHGDHSYWRWQQPTAVIVPPTAAYESSYAWGVGQVRSTPIHNQFKLGGGGGGIAGGAGQNAPYWPSSTGQFGLYPVRAPW